jgi:transposase-like protein
MLTKKDAPINSRQQKGLTIAQLNGCLDYAYRNEKCKHVFATEFSLTLRKTVEVIRIEPITNTTNCIFCNSLKIAKDGIRHNKYGDIQKFNCKLLEAKPEIITSAMQLYFTGESLRNVQKFLKMQGVKKSHVAVYKWIRKYVGLMNNYLEQIQPNVSDMES